jgi:hypothetical protein
LRSPGARRWRGWDDYAAAGAPVVTASASAPVRHCSPPLLCRVFARLYGST